MLRSRIPVITYVLRKKVFPLWSVILATFLSLRLAGTSPLSFDFRASLPTHFTPVILIPVIT